MPSSLEDSRLELMHRLQQMLVAKLSAHDAALVIKFLMQYYIGVSPYDLRDRGIEDLYGSLLSQWNFLYKRLPGESKVRVYNPQLEVNGWQSNHTIIEIVHENKPFLLDSIRLALQKLDINICLLIHAEGVRFERNEDGEVEDILAADYVEQHVEEEGIPVAEAPIYIEIDRQSSEEKLELIAANIAEVLLDVDIMVEDWQAMLTRLTDVTQVLEQANELGAGQDRSEVIEFLHWLGEDHFTFIGYAEYAVHNLHQPDGVLEFIPGSGLGTLRDEHLSSPIKQIGDLYIEAQRELANDDLLMLGKTDTVATVHRPAYTDFIAIKIFDAVGNLIKIVRFIGLYTASVYNEPAESIPYIRLKIDWLIKQAGFRRTSHDGRVLLHIIETLPRDELIQAHAEELFDVAIGILHLQERQQIRLFVRRDIYGRYFSCLVYVPRETFNSQLRTKMQEILLDDLQGNSVTFDTKFSESILARIHFIVRVKPQLLLSYDVREMEQKLIEAARSWNDDLDNALYDRFGEEIANILFKRYANAFPVSYQEFFSAQIAVADIEHIEHLTQNDANSLGMSLYRPIEDPEDTMRFKLFGNAKTIPLSDIVPILEHMGLRIISERPYEIELDGAASVWINDYKMVYTKEQTLSLQDLKENFQDAFAAIWNGRCENDGFNRLVISAGLTWRNITILRAYYRYLWQIGLAFSQNYVEDACFNNTDITLKLVNYFLTKFNLESATEQKQATLAQLKQEIEAGLEQVTSLNEDRIIRSYLGCMEATVRTNFFQRDPHNAADCKNYISFKLDSGKVPDLPLPKPVCEIFMYAPYVEGVHLRGDRVARGGLRWSDRREDFRTEVLGLMKAQQVKNAVIVPLGAKGGFVVKRDLQAVLDRNEKMQIVINCYQNFIRALLDLTDSYHGQTIIKPKDVVCWDEDDPYLVVAADKGTATFSDIANQISQEYNFWLGDAFASGGSAGYDHKKMAITARGAWESVKLHFAQLGIDVQTQSITVFGIGDMAGDVFGNGMLLSQKIKLVAAFNHMHIFVDPDPDPEQSYLERKRLFELPGSGWNDYDQKLISTGGGVFLRSAKKITLSPQMKKLFNLNADSLQPNDLIKAILMLKVDLFYNGGIGTFVKANSERNADVGDRVNDVIRINASQLRVRAVCEGGNLGFTQLARIEYAKLGGIINTDAIDNSAGVNCSDHEVNIKILLDAMIVNGDLTNKQRNELLFAMTDDVARLVLTSNIKQNEALNLTDYQAADNLQMHYRLQKSLERNAGLDPLVEHLPDAEELNERIEAKQGFTRPEIAVLMAYAKNNLKKQLLASNLPDDPYLHVELEAYFPTALHEEKFCSYVQNHRLKRAIIATQVSNFIIDDMGINFIQRLAEESNVESHEIATAYIIVREVFTVNQMRESLHALPPNISAEVRLSIVHDYNRLVRRATRWFLRNRIGKMDIEQNIELFKDKLVTIQAILPNVLTGAWLDEAKARKEKLLKAGIDSTLAESASMFYTMFTALDIIEASLEEGFVLEDLAKLYFIVGSIFKLGWFGELIKNQHVTNYWEALARAAFRDDVDKQQRNLAVSILKATSDDLTLEERLNVWLQQHTELITRWDALMAELKSSTPTFTMFAVTLRELLNVSHAVKVTKLAE